MNGKIEYIFNPNWYTKCQIILYNPKCELVSNANISNFNNEIKFNATALTGEYVITHHKLYRIYEGIEKFLKVINKSCVSKLLK